VPASRIARPATRQFSGECTIGRTGPPTWSDHFYIKAAFIDDLPPDLVAYRAKHPEFPHEPTADQFF
jgi:hypothetical protein